MNAANRNTFSHYARRIIHLSILIIPFAYYYFLTPLFSERILHAALFIFIFFVFLLEKLRLRMKLVLFAQRQYEATHISAFAWTMLAIGLVLIFSPAVSFSIAIIATCALVDPLVGEMRLHHFNKIAIFISGFILALLVWITCALYYHFSLYFAFILAPISVVVEWPQMRWVDDNALMLLVPLTIILLLRVC